MAGEHPVIGVGADQFPHHLPALKAVGDYPVHLPDYSPHSAWFGNLAEAGYAGALALFTFVGFAIKRAVTSPWRRAGDDRYRCLAVLLLTCAIGGMVMDLFHLRFLWVALGMLIGMGAWYEVQHPQRS